jgi:predicted Fe-Mo cluster-binding NifX family protein
MKIAFPTNNKERVASHIGLCKGFLIVDTKTGERTYIENPVMKTIQEEHIDLKGTKEHQRGLGTGRLIPPLLAEAGVNVLVSHEFGEGMGVNLEREGIIPYETGEKNIENALNQIKEEDMREFEKGYGRGFGYGRGYGYGRGFGNRAFDERDERGYGYSRGAGFGRGYGCRGRGLGRGYGRGFGFRRRWED